MITTEFLNTKIDSSDIVGCNYDEEFAIFNLYKYVVDYTYECCSVFTKSFPSYVSVKVLIDNGIVSSDFATHDDCIAFYNYAQCIKLIHYSLRDDSTSRMITEKFCPSIEWLRKINELMNKNLNESYLYNRSSCLTHYSDDVLLDFFNKYINQFLDYKNCMIGSLIIYLTLVKHKIFRNNNDQTAFVFLLALLAQNGIPPFYIKREYGGEYYSLMYDFLLTNNADKIVLFLLDQFKKSNSYIS